MRGAKSKVVKELKSNELEIQFIDPFYTGSFGAKPIIVHQEAAKRYVEKGVAKIVRDCPEPNPVPEKEETLELIPEMVEEPSTATSSIPSCIDQIIDNPYSVHVTWIGAYDILGRVRKVAEEVGFFIVEMTPIKLHTTSALCSDAVLVSSDLQEFDEFQKVSINILLFQKKIPYLIIARDFNEATDTKRITNSILNSKSIIFLEEEIMDKWIDTFGDIMKNWIVFKDSYLFWKEIGIHFGRKNV